MKYGGAYMRIDIQMKDTLTRTIRKKKWSLAGLTTFETNGNVLIEISEKENPTIAEFSVTLLHELLHVWLEVIKKNGATIDLRKDHRFITSVEQSVIKLAKVLKGGHNEKERGN